MSDIKKLAADLVSKMTLEEKVSQMVHTAPAIDRLGIPAHNWWNEALHGVAGAGTATMFPQSIALAATFNQELVNRVADVISTEGRAKFHAAQEEGDCDIFKGLTFWSPTVNIFRDPRWGRGQETYGEDPYLTARLGVAYITGLQGPDRNSLKSAACAKHFAVHSGPESERHVIDTQCNEYDLWNTYLPAFKAAVTEAGVEGIMGAYSRYNGVPCCGHELLLMEILRGKWGFDGYVTSDCGAINNFHTTHHYTDTASESAALGISRGCDISCGPTYAHALTAIEAGLLKEADIDRAVTRLMTTRMRLGLLGAPENKTYSSIPYSALETRHHRDLNLEAAKASLTLLKNDGILPLSFSKIKTLGVIGPNADSRNALEGSYCGRASGYITPLLALKALAEENNARVLYSEGCHLYKEKVCPFNLTQPDDRLSEALAVTKASDAVVLFLGLDFNIEGEEIQDPNAYSTGDKRDLNLPPRQQELLEKITAAAADKPVILVVISGGALAFGWAQDNVNGIIQAFYPGARGGEAIAEAIFGKFSPEGKLPVTFYRSIDDLPDFKDYAMAGRTYRYFKGEPLYPFGFGLSYSTFAISDFGPGRDFCTIKVTNTGKIAAGQTLQVYVKSPDTCEIHALAGISKVFLQPGESQTVNIALNPDAFSRYNENGEAQVIPGEHILYAGLSQPDERSIALMGTRPLKSTVRID